MTSQALSAEGLDEMIDKICCGLGEYNCDFTPLLATIDAQAAELERLRQALSLTVSMINSGESLCGCKGCKEIEILAAPKEANQ